MLDQRYSISRDSISRMRKYIDSECRLASVSARFVYLHEVTPRNRYYSNRFEINQNVNDKQQGHTVRVGCSGNTQTAVKDAMLLYRN